MTSLTVSPRILSYLCTPVHPLTVLLCSAQHSSSLAHFTEYKRFNKKISGKVFWVRTLSSCLRPQLLPFSSLPFPPLLHCLCYIIIVVVLVSSSSGNSKLCPQTPLVLILLYPGYINGDLPKLVYFDLQTRNDAYVKGLFWKINRNKFLLVQFWHIAKISIKKTVVITDIIILIYYSSILRINILGFLN